MKLSTQSKLRIARRLSRIVCSARRLLGRPSRGVFERRHTRYELDLREGIDLSIYLFSVFEPDVVAYYERTVGPDAVVIDIGANIGAHTLQLAGLCGDGGKVIALEPTAWAFGKLLRNIELNPGLKQRIHAMQAFLGPQSFGELPESICSSWPMDVAETSADARSEGRACSTQGASALSLDQLVESLDLQRLDLVKLDVDGHELDVLGGSHVTLSRFRPRFIVELAPYVFADREKSIMRILGLMQDNGYRKARLGKHEISLADADAIVARIPHEGGVNALIE